MWKQTTLESNSHNTKFRIEESGEELSIKKWLLLLKNSEAFRKWYNSRLADTDYAAFFWENPPFGDSILDQSYECNIIDSPFLSEKDPAPETFQNYFEEDKEIVTFPNLGRDALLLVPTPRKEASVYTHIGEFVRRADWSQIDRLWQKTAYETMKAISSTPKWLSTSGLGVFWLHIRIDRYPKYYQTAEYKQT
jgi:hypothetical protein